MVGRLLIVCLVILVAGCAQQRPQPEPPGEPAVEVPEREPPTPVEAEPAPVVPPAADTQPPVPEPAVADVIAIVLSDRTPAFENVAIELDLLLDDYLLYDLADKSLAPPVVFTSIREMHADVVIAIGLEATREAIMRSPVPVVFCQVFNIGDSHDASVPVRGVASTPPFALQVAAWKQLEPDLQTIGAILGRGHDELIAEAQLATAEHGITLRHRIANSDRETLFAFQRMAPAIDGFWLFPDNRVLSVEILQEMLDYAARHDVEIAVFNHALLEMGATLSFTTVDSDIAATALAVATRMVRGEVDELPWITPLNDVRVGGVSGPAPIDLAPGSGSHAGGER